MNELDKALAPKSDQLNADDLLGVEKTITITDVKISDSEQPVGISYDGDNGKPWKPCKSMGRVLRYVWGNDHKAWVGKSVTLFNDKTVKWAGVEVGGIRISHVSHISRDVTVPLSVSKGKRKPYTVKPLAKTETMDGERFLEILADVDTATTREELNGLNIAKHKEHLSDSQAKELREAYKTKLNELKKLEEEPPV